MEYAWLCNGEFNCFLKKLPPNPIFSPTFNLISRGPGEANSWTFRTLCNVKTSAFPTVGEELGFLGLLSQYRSFICFQASINLLFLPLSFCPCRYRPFLKYPFTVILGSKSVCIYLTFDVYSFFLFLIHTF